MNVGWLSGWAVPPRHVRECAERAFPRAAHRALTPTRENARALAEDAAINCVCGYSLGALLLCEAYLKNNYKKPLVCWAPFVAFCAEDGGDGKTPRGRLRALGRRLQTRRNAALAGFYRLAGLPPALDDGALSSDALHAGLALLDTVALAAPPEAARCVRGACDPFIDAARADALWKHARVLPDVGHDIGALTARIRDDARDFLPFV